MKRTDKIDLELLKECKDAVASIESFCDPSAATKIDSDRLKALLVLDRGTFKGISDLEVGAMSAAMEQSGTTNIFLNTAWGIQVLWLKSSDMMNKTCRLGKSILHKVLIPEIFTMYVSRKYNLHCPDLIEEVTLGHQKQLEYHSYLKMEVSHKLSFVPCKQVIAWHQFSTFMFMKVV